TRSDSPPLRRSPEATLLDHAMHESIFLSSLGKADAEAGASLSLVQRRADSSHIGRDMIARLSPAYAWLAATAGLQKWLGRSIAELNARSFFEVVHPDDAIPIRSALEKALRVGEGHDIRCRILAGGGEC